MRVLSLFLTAAIHCSHNFIFAASILLAEDVQLELSIELEIRLNSSEMNRIFSEPNHLKLAVEKEALLEESEIHIEPCLDLFRSSIKEHNNKIDTAPKDGKQLEFLPLSKDGSRFQLKGTAKDFVGFLKMQEKDIHASDVAASNGSSFVVFDETYNKKGQVQITANYEDGRSAMNLPKTTLTKCIGFLGDFRRQVEDTNAIGTNRKLNPVKNTANDIERNLKLNEIQGQCISSSKYFDDFREKYLPSLYTIKTIENVSDAAAIRKIYSVPKVDETCDYRLPNSAVYEQQGFFIDADDIVCYNKYNNLQQTTVVTTSAKSPNVPIGGEDFIGAGVIRKPYYNPVPERIPNIASINNGNKLSLDVGSTSGEPNLDVQMISVSSGGTKILNLYAVNDNLVETLNTALDELDSLENDDVPAVVSISYSAFLNSKLEKDKARHVCKKIGHLSTKKNISFFISSGDSGACAVGQEGVCGTYTDQFTYCPYITTVGGSFFNSKSGTETLSTANEDQGLNICSSGGFSGTFTEPEFNLTYQKTHVDDWRSSEASKKSANVIPSPYQYGPTYELENGTVGAGNPDVSALSSNILSFVANQPAIVGGTSASSPIFAGIVNLCASQLPVGHVGGFGWLNPTLYMNSEEIFFDIIGGNNQFSEEGIECSGPNGTDTFYGFEATKGWDPASGLGTLGKKEDDIRGGFERLCTILLRSAGVDTPFDEEKIKCNKSSKVSKKKEKKEKKTNGRKFSKDTIN